MKKINTQALGDRVRLKRIMARQVIRQASDEIGISPSSLSRAERGYPPNIDTFVKLCDWLSIDLSKVLGTEIIERMK